MSNNYFHQNYYPNTPQTQGQQQYSGYQTAPPANNAPTTRQYQQQASATNPQSTDYLNYNRSQGYSGQTQYGGQQTGPWTSANYGGNREQTRGAAEALSNLSNSAYAGSNPVVNSPNFAQATATSGRYTPTTPAQPQRTQQTQPQAPSASSQATNPIYGQVQARSRSVNANRVPTQSAQAVYQQQQQRSNSPAQMHYAQTTPVSAATTRVSNTASSNSYNTDYSHRQLPSVDTARAAQNPVASASYNYSDAQATVPVSQATNSTAAEHYTQGTITVDPMAVYDRWPEIQRQEEARKAREAAEEAARAEQARKEEEAARIEQARKEEEARRLQEDQQREAQRLLPEQEKAEEERRAREARAAQAKQKPVTSYKRKPSAQSVQLSGSESGPTGSGGEGIPSADPLEAEIRAMMAKMRELSSRDPALLARIWEEERRAKGPKSPTVRTTATPQPVPLARTTSTPQPPSAQAKPVPVANQSKKAARKQDQPPKADGSAAAKSRPAPIPHPPPAKPQPSMATPTPPPPPPAKPGGSTIWPADNKTVLASAAAGYLNALNPEKPLTSEKICTILDDNPSYIVLCEILEGMGLKLDRAAFAKNLLTAVPDINRSNNQTAEKAQGAVQSEPQRQSASRELQHSGGAQRVAVQLPAANGKAPAYSQGNGRNNMGQQTMGSASRLPNFPTSYPPADQIYPPFLDNSPTTSTSPAPMAQMIVRAEAKANIKPEYKPPANKEEAARKRTFSDIVDLTQLSDDTHMEPPPPPKRHQENEPGSAGGGSFRPYMGTPTTNNFPSPVGMAPQQAAQPAPIPPLDSRFKHVSVVQPIDKKKALRRNTYNIKTIARDVLLACGRHPEERQLNQHLEDLKAHLPGVDNTSDLSTVRWDLIDPGQPPKGYYKERGPVVEAEDADHEEDSDDDEAQQAQARARVTQQRRGVGVDGASEATQHAPAPHLSTRNPFKTRGRPRNSDIQSSGHGDGESRRPHQSPRLPQTPAAASTNAQSSSDPRHRSGSANLGYSAFRSVMTGPDGTPLPKKKGRPVGWRKAIHGSAAVQAAAAGQPFTPNQSSGLRKVSTSNDNKSKTMSKDGRSSPPRYQVFRCQWQDCKAELHNLDTLRKHVHKVHCKPTAQGSIECVWEDCGREITNIDPVTGITVERRTPFNFGEEAKWRQHLEQQHFGPLSWQLGDGPASGLSDNHDSASETYLSDSRGRRVTPRIQPSPSRPLEHRSSPFSAGHSASQAGRGRGRPPRALQEQEAVEAQRAMVALKKRIGGPGIDRGGATLVNEKRRRGFVDNDEEEQFIDAED